MGTVRNRIADTSVAHDGISEVTTTRSVGHPEHGMIYHPGLLAAVTPVHLHQLTPGRYVMVFSRRWYDATVSLVDPGAYLDDFSEDTEPGWAIVTGTGTWSFPARTATVPGPQGRVLTAATSRSNTYLYLLSSYDGGGYLQHFRWSPDRDMLLPVGEEYLGPVDADGQKVIFDKGVFLDGEHLVVVGSGDSDDAVYMARKPWGRVGANRVWASGGDRGDLDDPSWRYASATGWVASSTELAALPMTTLGPVSVYRHRDTMFMATVAADGDDRFAQVWRRRYGTWSPVAGTTPLGSVADNTYLGGTLQLQPYVRTSSSDLVVPCLTAVASMHEVVDDEVEEVSHTEYRIDVAWDKWTVSL